MRLGCNQVGDDQWVSGHCTHRSTLQHGYDHGRGIATNIASAILGQRDAGPFYLALASLSPQLGDEFMNLGQPRSAYRVPLAQ